MTKVFLICCFLISFGCTQKLEKVVPVSLPSPIENKDLSELTELREIQVLAVQAHAQVMAFGAESMTSDLRCRLNLKQVNQKLAEENLLKQLRMKKNLSEFLIEIKTWSSKGPAEQLTRLQILQLIEPIKNELCSIAGCADLEFKNLQLSSDVTYQEIKKLKSQIELQFPLSKQDQNPGSCFN